MGILVSLVCDDNVTMAATRLVMALPVSLSRSRREGHLRRGGAVLTVGKDVSTVESGLSAGTLACPACGGRLGPWGHARERALRAAGEGQRWRCRPRRARCPGCAVTHVLLPVTALVRRADVVEVIGAGLALAATGAGHRVVAERLGRPAGTVRGWLRRGRLHAPAWRVAFTTLFVELAPAPVLPSPTGTPLSDAVAAITAAGVAAAGRWASLSDCSPWELACAVSHGRLLSPTVDEKLINTSCPW